MREKYSINTKFLNTEIKLNPQEILRIDKTGFGAISFAKDIFLNFCAE